MLLKCCARTSEISVFNQRKCEAMKKNGEIKRVSPNLTCYFIVDIDGRELPVYEVTGLEEKLRYLYYRSGSDDSDFAARPTEEPGGQNITIKWGIFHKDVHGMDLFHWWRDERFYESDKDTLLDIKIIMLDENETPVMQWNCEKCQMIRYIGPTFKADESTIAMQTLEIEASTVTSKMV